MSTANFPTGHCPVSSQPHTKVHSCRPPLNDDEAISVIGIHFIIISSLASQNGGLSSWGVYSTNVKVIMRHSVLGTHCGGHRTALSSLLVFFFFVVVVAFQHLFLLLLTVFPATISSAVLSCPLI